LVSERNCRDKGGKLIEYSCDRDKAVSAAEGEVVSVRVDQRYCNTHYYLIHLHQSHLSTRLIGDVLHSLPTSTKE
jgi:hypothetical protein